MIPVLPLPGVFSVFITLTLQVGDLAVLLLLQLGKLLAVGLEALAVLQFQAVVLQLQVQQLLLDIIMLVLERRKRDRVSTRGVICLLPRVCLMSCLRGQEGCLCQKSQVQSNILCAQRSRGRCEMPAKLHFGKRFWGSPWRQNWCQVPFWDRVRSCSCSSLQESIAVQAMKSAGIKPNPCGTQIQGPSQSSQTSEGHSLLLSMEHQHTAGWE